MEYKVVPFVATLDQKNLNSSVVAQQLEMLIKKFTDQGWKYLRLEIVSTYVQADAGCFGIGGTPGYISSYQMIVFSKENENLSPSNH